MQQRRFALIRLLIAALAIALVSFSAGAVSILKFLGSPTKHTWSSKRFFITGMVGDSLINGFHNLFYNRQPWYDSQWLGVQIWKYPTDLLEYQEIIHQLRPDVILDIGTYKGGSALYFASLLDLIGSASGRVISVDIKHPPVLPKHARITYLLGSSTSAPILEKIRNSIRPGDKVMAFLDSDHTMAHVLNELHSYGPIVTPGSYLVVEDSNINGHPVYPDFGPGPMEAIHEYLKENPPFKIDKSREKYLLTVAPDGFLLRQ
jgi:cephalosporin hydroxylase